MRDDTIYRMVRMTFIDHFTYYVMYVIATAKYMCQVRVFWMSIPEETTI